MSLSLSANGDSFIFNLPSDFIPPSIDAKYQVHLKNYHKPYAKVLDYINANIKDITLPGMNLPTVEQIKFYGKKRDFRSAISPYDLYGKDFNVTFKNVDFFVNYFIVMDSVLYHYGEPAKPFLDTFVITVVDFHRRELIKIYLKEVLIKSLSDFRFANQDKTSDEKDFTVSFSCNYIDIEYIPQFESGSTEGTLIENYSDIIKRNDI